MTNPDQDIEDIIQQAQPDPTINPEHRDRLREQALDAFDQRDNAADAEPPNPLFTFKGATVMKIAASLAFLAAVGTFIVTSTISPARAIAFEDVARAILKIENASFEISGTITHADGKTDVEESVRCVTKLPALLRTEMPEGDTVIIDFEKNKMLVIDPKKKAALVMDEYVEFNEGDNVQKNLFGEIQDHLRNAEKGGNFGEIKYEKLGEKQINGTQAVGFRVLNPDAKENDYEGEGMFFNILDIWADAKTGGPLFLEFTMDLDDGSRVTTSFKNFTYNQKLDPKLFSFEAPEGYELIDGLDLLRVGKVFGDDEDEPGELGGTQAEAAMLLQEMERDDVIKALRMYSQMTDGQLPNNLSMTEMINGVMKAWEQANPGKPLFDENASDVTFADTQMNKNIEVIALATTYLETLKEAGGSYTYRGKGVKTNDEPTPVLWIKARDDFAYTVVYNDLTVLNSIKGPDEQ